METTEGRAMLFRNSRNSNCSRNRSIERRPLAFENLEGRRVLAATNVGMIQGEVFVDSNSNLASDPGEEVNGATVELYLDSNGNGVFDSTLDALQTSTTTNANGEYSFSGLSGGTYFTVQPQQIVSGVSLQPGSSNPINLSGNANSGTVVDSFTTPTGPTVDFHPTGTPVDEVHTAIEALGGQRDFTVELLTGNAFDSVEMEAHSGVLDVNPGFSSTGRYVATWDGTDSNGNGLNATGLSGVDLTEVGGQTGVGLGFCLTDVQFDQPNGIIRIRVYSDATNFSIATISSIPAFSSQDFFIPFSGSSNGIGFAVGGGTGADFTNVGAVQLEIESTVQAMDGQLSQFGVVAPEIANSSFVNPAPVAAIDVEKLTNGVQADTSNQAPTVPTGSTVTWTYIVENTGDAPLNNVTLSDNQIAGFITNIVSRANGNADNTLDPGEVWTFEATGIATSGLYSNKATANGQAPTGEVVMDMDMSHYIGEAPSIDIEKFTNGFQADNVGDSDVPTILEGEPVTWTYQVRNDGDTDITDVEVVDNQIGQIFNIVNRSGNADNILQPGEVWNYEASGVAIAGNYTNTGTVTGRSISGAPLTDVDPSRYIGGVAAIDIEKATNGVDADISGTGPEVFVGSLVTFTYVVRNAGTVPLSNVQVSDDNGTPGNAADDFFATFDNGDANSDTLLDTNEIWNFSATRSATLGVHENDSVVTGTAPNNQVVTDLDPSNHTGIALPSPISKRRFLASSF